MFLLTVRDFAINWLRGTHVAICNVGEVEMHQIQSRGMDATELVP